MLPIIKSESFPMVVPFVFGFVAVKLKLFWARDTDDDVFSLPVTRLPALPLWSPSELKLCLLRNCCVE